MHERLASLQRRYRRLPPLLVDGLLATLVLALSLLEVSLADAPAAARLEGALIVGPIALAVAIRRRLPFTAMLVGLLVLVGLGLADKAVAEATGAPWLTTFLLVFWFGMRHEGPRLWAGAVAGAAIATASVLTDQYPNSATEVMFAIGLAIGAPLFTGQLLRNRTALNRTLRAKAQRAEVERARAAELAAAEERSRIAGELHDVVAHALGAMTIQASAAHRQAQRGDQGADAARGAFLTVEDTGREALGELRRLLGVLRREDDDLALAPQPRLAHVADLLRRIRAAGLPVDLEIAGDPPRELPAGIDLTGYRLVQETLGEALEHAGAGRARVRVEYRPADVVVEIHDDGRAGARRLLGLRERVRVYGGDFDAGARRPSGHRVRVRLPVGRAA